MQKPIHQHIQQRILDHDWTGVHLHEAAKLWEHLQQCEACRHALRDYDMLRGILNANQNTGADEVAEPDRAMDASGSRPADHPPTSVLRLTRWRRAGAVAAMLVIAIAGGWLAGHFGASSNSAGPPSGASFAAFLPQNPAEKASVFDHVAQVFDHRASWVALSPHDTQMGLANTSIRHPSLMVVRLTCLHANKTISRTDLVIAQGQSALLDVPLDKHRLLRYRIAVGKGPAASLKLWAELRGDAGSHQTLAALSRRLHLGHDQVQNVGELVTDSGGYTLKVGLRQTRQGA